MSINEEYYKQKGKEIPMRYRKDNTLQDWHKVILDELLKNKQMEEEITSKIEEDIIRIVEQSLKKI